MGKFTFVAVIVMMALAARLPTQPKILNPLGRHI
jgi:hypothetical protein